MRNITIFSVIASALATFSAHAQLQTLVGTSSLDVPAKSYAVITSADSHNSADLQVTTQGAVFDYRLGDDSVNGFTFTGPATIQFSGNSPSFATIDVSTLRKAVGTNIQTLVVNPTNQTSATITVPAKSYAVIQSANTQSSATLSVTIQGVLFTYVLQDESPKNVTFAGPATVQLQGDQYGASFATVEVMPLRKSSKTQIVTLVASPTNTTSAILNVPANNYALVRSLNSESGALAAQLGDTTLNFNDIQDESPVGFTFAGPAAFQVQGDNFGPTFMTFEVGPNRK